LFVDAADSAQAMVDPGEAAELAGLRRVSDARPGKAGKGFKYTRADRSRLSDPDDFGSLVLELKAKAENELRRSLKYLTPEEAAVLALLRTHLTEKAEKLGGSSGSNSPRTQRTAATHPL